MAEFQEVMKQWSRMCKYYSEIVPLCEKCPAYDNSPPICGLAIHEYGKTAERISRIVMSWAAEHPELVYPTWGKWLSTTFHEPSSRVLSMPIPENYAAMLNVKPKNGQGEA